MLQILVLSASETRYVSNSLRICAAALTTTQRCAWGSAFCTRCVGVRGTLGFPGGLSPAVNLLFAVKSFGALFSPAFTERLFYFKVDILAQIRCVESLSQSPPSSSSPSPSSSINKVKFKLEHKRKEPVKTLTSNTFFSVSPLFQVQHALCQGSDSASGLWDLWNRRVSKGSGPELEGGGGGGGTD